jgi:hypothetical protein
MSEKEERKNIEQYFINYKRCWDDIKQYYEYIEMITGDNSNHFKITNLMKKLEDKHKFKMIVQ